MVCKLWRIHYFLACEVLDGGLLAFRASQVQHHVSGLIGPPGLEGEVHLDVITIHKNIL